MATAGSIVVDLLFRTGSFETDSKRAEQRMKQMAREVDQTISRFKSLAATAIGVGSLGAAIKSATGYMADMGNAAQRTSVSAQAFSELNFAAERASLSQGELERVLRRSTEAINHATKGGSKQAEALDALGISAYGAEGKLKKADEMLRDMADKFSKLEPGAKKTGLVIDLFGQQLGQKVIPLLNSGADGLDEMAAKARELGLVIDDEAAQAAIDFEDNLDDLKKSAKGLTVTLTSELIPAVSQLISQFSIASKMDNLFGWTFTSGSEARAPKETLDSLEKSLKSVRGQLETFKQASESNWFSKISLADDIKLLEVQIKGMEKRKEYLGALSKDEDERAKPKELPGVVVTPDVKSSKSKSKKVDEGDRLIKQMNERIALLGKETEYEQLAAKIGVEAITFRSGAQKEMALGLAKTLDMRTSEIEQEKILKDLREQQSVTQTQFMRDLAAFGQGDSVRQLNSELARTEDRYRAIIDARRNSPLGLSEGELAQIKESLDVELEMVRKHHADKRAIQEDWQLGAQDALANYADDVSNVYGSMNETVAGAFKGMEDSMVDFIKTGKLDFKSLADSVISDLIRITVQQSLMGPLAGFMGGKMGSIGSLFGFSGGGYTGDGGKYEPAGIVHKGEGVLSQEEIKALGGPTGFNSLRKAISGPRHSMGGMAGRPMLPPFPTGASQSNVSVSVTINSDGATKTQATGGYEKFAKEIGEYVDSRFQELQRQSYRPGGTAWQAKQGGF